MRKLLIDRGNSRIKVGLSLNEDIDSLKTEIFHNLQELKSFINDVGVIDNCIYSDVKKESAQLEELFIESGISFIRCNYLQKLPFKLDYKTPQTLGDDRIAAVAAANNLFPEKNSLVIDSGTCITYDFLDSEAIYRGGAISPGINMRYKAMHTMTAGLPELSFDAESDIFPGKSTESSMHLGVKEGIIAEAQSIIDRLSNKVGELNVLIGGGDRKFFETNLKGNIFARENLILEGLNSILSFHDSE